MTEPFISYFESGQIQSEKWYPYGVLHRTDGPAYVTYFDHGGIQEENWYLNGKRHRSNGPAYIFYKYDKSIWMIIWYLHGNPIRPEIWLTENKYKYPLTKDQETEFLLVFG